MQKPVKLREGRIYRVLNDADGLDRLEEVHKSSLEGKSLLVKRDEVPTCWEITGVSPCDESVLQKVQSDGVFVSKTKGGLREFKVRRFPVALGLKIDQRGRVERTTVRHDGTHIIDSELPGGKVRIEDFRMVTNPGELEGRTAGGMERVYIANSTKDNLFELIPEDRTSEGVKRMSEVLFDVLGDMRVELFFGRFYVDRGFKADESKVIFNGRGGFKATLGVYVEWDDVERFEKGVSEAVKVLKSSNPQEMEKGLNSLGFESLEVMNEILGTLWTNRSKLDPEEARAVQYHLNQFTKAVR